MFWFLFLFLYSGQYRGMSKIFLYLGKVRVWAEKHVLRLEVAVDDVLGVEVLERDQDLGDDEPGDPLRESGLLAGQDHLQHVAWSRKQRRC